MTLDGLAPKATESFLYSGLYSARDGLTAAQRSAWGLRERSFLTAREHASKKAEATLPPRLRRQISAPHSSKVDWPTRSLQRRPQRTSQRRIVAVSPKVMTAAFKRFSQLLPRRHPFALNTAYRRFFVRVGGLEVACIVFRGKIFTGAAKRYER